MEDKQGLLAYILAGWRAVQSLFGRATISIGVPMGRTIYEVLHHTGIIRPFEGSTLEDVAR